MTDQVKTDTSPMAVADPLAPFEKEGMLKLIAPAKVNLFLSIGNKQPDGFHAANNIMHALTLHDVLHIDHTPESEGGLVVDVRTYAREGLEPFAIASEDNLVFKAIHALAAKIERVADETIIVRIEKRIPQMAGLGGGSSDAAAALVGAAKLWGLDSSASEVIEVATQLGSDVAFFLQGGCAYFEGKGDLFLHELRPMKKPLVLIKPTEGVSTAAAYEQFDKEPDLLSQDVLQQALNARAAEEVPLYNNLTNAAESVLPELKQVGIWIDEQPESCESLLCGSGSTSFTICENMDDAYALVAKARNRGWWARSAAFSSIKASVIPK